MTVMQNGIIYYLFQTIDSMSYNRNIYLISKLEAILSIFIYEVTIYCVCIYRDFNHF